MIFNWTKLVRNYFPSGPSRPWREDLQWEYVATAALLRALVCPEQVLKTDAHNEAAGKPCRGGIANLFDHGPCDTDLVEIDATMCEMANEEGFSPYCQDIQRLDLDPEHYDMLIDCSTLDHVDPHHAPAVLHEYAKVLVKDGCLLLFVWESHDKDDLKKSEEDGKRPYGPNHQFWFPIWGPQKWAHAAGLETVSRAWYIGEGGMRQMTRYIFVKK